MTVGWTVVVPVRSTSTGKSRIEVPAAVRRSLATAMAADTLTAVAATPGVIRTVVMGETEQDRDLFGELTGITAWTGTEHGLNPAIEEARDRVVVEFGPVRLAVLPGDLPGLDPAELGRALSTAATLDRGVLADADGVGTTLLTALRAPELRPAFGGASFHRHRAGGAADLNANGTLGDGVRRDIDRLVDLVAALHGGGLGTRTAREVARILAPG